MIDNPNRHERRDPNLPDPRESEGQFGEEFGNDYGYGREGELGERYGENARNQDERNEYIDRYSPPDSTAVNADPGPGHLSDEELFDEINRRLGEQEGIDLTALEIQIAAGQVTISGLVAAPETRQAIEAIASQIEGVLTIKNRITVEEGQP